MLQYETLKTQELSPKASPICKLVLRINNPQTSETATSDQQCWPTSTQSKPNYQSKTVYVEHWDTDTKSQIYITVLVGPKQRTWIGRESLHRQRSKAETDPDHIQAQWPQFHHIKGQVF